ncbi:MAG: IS21 family transposase, partial [Candidatus Eisenbacteria bacterium]|nr:IS21 family transposase [Candidatus Eisenbacteria bacterium]
SELSHPGVTLQLLWIEYIQEHPDGYQYSRFCDLYRDFRRKLHPTMRQVHRSGEKIFVDFSGKRPEIVDPETGELRQVELFVGAFGASHFFYAEAVPSQELPHWIAAHVRMFEYFGGVSQVLVPDNLKSGVRAPCRYEPEVNRTYEEMARHYGAVVIPARSGKPRDKSKVENSVLLVQRWILAALRHRTFFSLAELNRSIRELLSPLNDRPLQKLGVSRRELFEQLDRPALQPLPRNRYEIGIWKRCRVNIDYHIEVEKNVYSVPFSLLREEVEARITGTTVEVFHKNTRIASHRRLPGRGRASTQSEHMPSSHRAHAEWTPSRILSWAQKTGPATGDLVAHILKSRPHPEQGYRACLGILRLGKRYGDSRLESACERALHLRSYSYRTVKNILASGVDRCPLEEPTTSTISLPSHENVRGSDYYD